ncbi:MAG: uroporphyrinogen decarboxylase family protein [Spirochaetales bacterium]|nr:uroporphyrinogen decarboxylase family protein [Spirochaetales bacterium]
MKAEKGRLTRMNDSTSELKLKVAPLLGFPGLHLTGSTITRNLFDAKLQSRTLLAIYEKFRPDILFTLMDLSAEAHALGLPVQYTDMESPCVKEHPVKDETALKHIDTARAFSHERLRVFADTVALTRKALPDVPLSAYIAGPFTLAGLMMSANDIAMNTILAKDFVKKTLDITLETAVFYARRLFDAGADLVTVLEPTAVILSPEMFWEFSGEYVQRLCSSVKGTMVLHICGNTTHLIPGMVQTGCRGLSLDADVCLPDIADAVPPEVDIIGNINPVAVMVDMEPEQVRTATHDLIASMAAYPNFILSTGCDLPPETPHANIEAFMVAGRDYAGMSAR